MGTQITYIQSIVFDMKWNKEHVLTKSDIIKTIFTHILWNVSVQVHSSEIHLCLIVLPVKLLIVCYIMSAILK